MSLLCLFFVACMGERKTTGKVFLIFLLHTKAECLDVHVNVSKCVQIKLSNYKHLLFECAGEYHSLHQWYLTVRFCGKDLNFCGGSVNDRLRFSDKIKRP